MYTLKSISINGGKGSGTDPLVPEPVGDALLLILLFSGAYCIYVVRKRKAIHTS
jgi:hypothetical protein